MAAAVAIGDAEAVVERDDVGDRAFTDDARVEDVPRERIARASASWAGDRLGAIVLERILHHLGDGGIGLGVAREDRLDGEAVELQHLPVLAQSR